MNWVSENIAWVAELTGIHILLCVPAILAAILIAVPVGYFATRRPRAGQPLISALGLAYALPALPLIVIIPAIIGTDLRSPATITVALAVYGVALLVRTAADAFASVDAETRLSARAVGMPAWGMFWRVDLPLAVPVLISGIRVVAVSTISLATIGALVGIPSLGSLLTDGFSRGIIAEVLTGIVVTAVLAALVDALIVLLGRALTPWKAARR